MNGSKPSFVTWTTCVPTTARTGFAIGVSPSARPSMRHGGAFDVGGDGDRAALRLERLQRALRGSLFVGRRVGEGQHLLVRCGRGRRVAELALRIGDAAQVRRARRELVGLLILDERGLEEVEALQTIARRDALACRRRWRGCCRRGRGRLLGRALGERAPRDRRRRNDESHAEESAALSRSESTPFSYRRVGMPPGAAGCGDGDGGPAGRARIAGGIALP